MKTERQFILPKEPENSCGALYERERSRGRYNSLFGVSFFVVWLPWGDSLWSVFTKEVCEKFSEVGKGGDRGVT